MQKLREIVNSTKDPVTIEHTLKQIKASRCNLDTEILGQLQRQPGK